MIIAILQTLGIIVAIVGVFSGGYWCGLVNGEARQRASYDRLLRLEPPDRTPGAPTNLDAPPSTPRSPQWRSGRLDGESHM